MRHLNTFLTTFLLRKSTGKNEMYAIYLRINLNGEKLEISTKEQVTIDNWDFAKGCVKGKSIEIKLENAMKMTMLSRFKMTTHFGAN